MVSLKNFYTPRETREQVFADIKSVLQAILDFCIANKDLLTQEERSSFIDEYRSLEDAYDQLGKDKGTSFNSTLPGLLDECEKLKLRVQRACRKRRQDNIRKAPVAPAAIATPESFKSSIALIDPDPPVRAPSEISISAQSNPNLVTTGGDGSNSSTPSLLTGTSSSVVSASIPEAQETASSTYAAPTERSSRAPPPDQGHIIFDNNNNCMIFEQYSSIGSPTFNIDSEGATGATLISCRDDPSLGISARREGVMYFGPGVTASSATLNVRSPGASGVREYTLNCNRLMQA
ncbi:uncharacterized protein F5891DRAFT_1025982 [Suillus fuscotomentosus]|uniref:Uncharacterized protein n=1 Tax=Suillus fuscotomentosus TaxID=1912939 RepID=A0AAD4HMB9_9AGAM|nr:uncharacterized protein F5891DRAFT_1025982 [Suillus fuscotomentosus]KAG1901888.1 hypothetical protein F5891DRAFT_1025982 [Suillus fuscotomentosus]